MNKCIICGEGTTTKSLCIKPECRSQHSRNTIAASFAKHGGQITQFRTTNGMSDPATRDKVSATLRRIKHKPPVQGGNGRGPTKCEKLLSDLLGWPTNVIVNTHGGRAEGHPTHYKIDVGNPTLKIAIEIDGTSHGAIVRQEQDSKKTKWLESQGWRVVRFTNREVLSLLPECVERVKELL